MNWYKTVKVAVVIDAPYLNWMQIGHCNHYNPQREDFCPGGIPEVEEMWFINKNFQFSSRPTVPGTKHEDVFDFANYFAIGRYVRDSQNPDGLCSVQVDKGQNWSPQRQEYQYERVTRMLEQRYGPQARIVFFKR